MGRLIQFLEERLKLRINQQKSDVDLLYRRTYLGFGFYATTRSRIGVRLAPEIIEKVKEKVG